MKIVVGQGSCGIAAGAGRVYDALAQSLAGYPQAQLTIAGCIGMCYLEPIVDLYGEDGRLTRLVRVQEQDVPAIVAVVETGSLDAVSHLEISEDDKAFLAQQTGDYGAAKARPRVRRMAAAFACRCGEAMFFSSAGLERKPASIRIAGQAASTRTRNRANFTPRSGPPTLRRR